MRHDKAGRGRLPTAHPRRWSDRWQALKDAVTGAGDAEDALDDATGGALELGDALDGATGATGATGRQAGADAAAETGAIGWAGVSDTLADYAAEARDIGNALAGAFQGAENAIGEFVRTGEPSFRDLVTSLI